MDHGMTGMASAFPTIFTAIGIYLIYRYLPNGATHKGVHLDWIGALLLGICLFALVFWLNYGAILGWGSAFVLTCAAITIISFILLLIAEKENQFSADSSESFQEQDVRYRSADHRSLRCLPDGH